MIHATLGFVLRETDRGPHVLLGVKKRGFGVGKLNGFGGKLHIGESPREAMSRELFEESGLIVKPTSLEPRGLLLFRFPYAPHFDHRIRVYATGGFEGIATETEEMIPKWHPVNDLPMHRMWNDDPLWLPSVLAGHVVVGRFVFGEDNEEVARYRLWVSPDTPAVAECSDSIPPSR